MLYVALLQFITTYFKKQFQKAPLIIINFNVLYVYGIQDVMGGKWYQDFSLLLLGRYLFKL